MKWGVGRAAILLLPASAGTSLAMHGCKEPTQVTVEIRTLAFKCQELRRVTIVVAKEPEGAERNWQSPQAEVDARTSCASDDEVGTLVLTPSGTTGAVMVLASYTDEKCVAPDYAGCIVARRRFSFIDNVRLHLPITLEASCKDVPCNALSSCRSGVCVSSETDCSTDGTCATPAEPVLLPDGGTIPPPADVFVPPDALREDVVVPPVDSGSDADAGKTYGNLCPTPAPTDCQLESKVCCAAAGYSCTNGPDGATPACLGTGRWYPCTGRKHCNTNANEFCCYLPFGSGFMPWSACSTAPGPACMSGVVLCNTDDDCPAPSRCNQVHDSGTLGANGAHLKQCAPP